MAQRRTPGGQRPSRRPGQPGRAARDAGVRGEPRAGSSRAPGSARNADAPRSASRPATARRAAGGGGGGAARRTSAPQPRRLTGRATALIAVLIALALAYTYPIRVYLSQQSDIARMEATQAAQRARIGELSDQAALWQDPEYIKIQAKQRFYMVYPGDVPLVVLSDPDGAARDAGADPQAARNQPAAAWYDTMWSSIRAANEDRRHR